MFDKKGTKANKLDIVESLIKSGADLSTENRDGETVLFIGYFDFK